MHSLAGWIAHHAARTPERTALEFPDGSLSYAAFGGRIATLIDWLETEIKVQPGDRVAWLGHNVPDLLALLFACAETRTLFTPLNWRLAAAELVALAEDALPRVIVVQADCADLAETFNGHHQVVTSGFTRPGLGKLPEASERQLQRARSVAPQTPALLIYTSGTTGLPKGVVLSQEALFYNALNAIDMHDMQASDRILNVLPMFHVGGLNIQSLPALYRGATLILEPRFEPERTLSLLSDKQASLAVLVPPMMQVLSALEGWSSADLSGLRCVTTGSTDVPVELIERFHARNLPVIQIYGCTETGPMAIYQTLPEAQTSVGSIGRAGLHSTIRLVDAEDAEVPEGQPGRILVQGRHCAGGTWDRARQAVEPYPSAWIDTGDVAERDPSGLFWFKDRIKNVIISGGENIYPAELERILGASGLLQEWAVVGRADPRWGEVPVVVGVPAATTVTAVQVLQLFEGQVARYKQPQAVVFVDALPRTGLGKIAVGQVRDLVRETDCQGLTEP